jgi:crotonobetainyl-CoA:carnitine CoA-transferase CaiB-like acyl-CoA transferase
LFQSAREGCGARIDMSLFDAAVCFLWIDSAGSATMLDAEPGRSSRIVEGIHCYRFIDGWAVVCPVAPDELHATCRAFGIQVPDDPKYGTARLLSLNRVAFIQDIHPLLVESAARMTVGQAEDRCAKEGVPFGQARRIEDLPDDPQAKANELFFDFDHPVAGRMRHVRPAALFNGEITVVAGAAPRVGEHTDTVLADLGYTAVADLRSRGIVA